MHRWHHAADEDAHNTNYATKLAIWDHLFGTAFYPKERKPIGYGLEEAGFPKSYVQQHIYAFRPFEE
jgi:sterol desaturase/sphingolipid hydroxylase (fatty acid hydroxylase superfamily)